MNTRIQQVSELIRQLAAQYFQRHTPKSPLVTVTRADVSKDLKNATIFITVLPEDKEDTALDTVKKELSGFRKYAGDNMSTKNTPFFEVKIDDGDKKRRRIDEISRNL